MTLGKKVGMTRMGETSIEAAMPCDNFPSLTLFDEDATEFLKETPRKVGDTFKATVQFKVTALSMSQHEGENKQRASVSLSALSIDAGGKEKENAPDYSDLVAIITNN